MLASSNCRSQGRARNDHSSLLRFGSSCARCFSVHRHKTRHLHLADRLTRPVAWRASMHHADRDTDAHRQQTRCVRAWSRAVRQRARARQRTGLVRSGKERRAPDKEREKSCVFIFEEGPVSSSSPLLHPSKSGVCSAISAMCRSGWISLTCIADFQTDKAFFLRSDCSRSRISCTTSGT